MWALSASGVLGATPAAARTSGLTFVQISDSHIGFSRPENPDVLGTFAKAIADINAPPRQPAFVVHTGAPRATIRTRSNRKPADPIERERLRAAIAALPDEQRAALELAYFGELTHVQVAQRLGAPLGTVKSRLALARHDGVERRRRPRPAPR